MKKKKQDSGVYCLELSFFLVLSFIDGKHEGFLRLLFGIKHFFRSSVVYWTENTKDFYVYCLEISDFQKFICLYIEKKTGFLRLLFGIKYYFLSSGVYTQKMDFYIYYFKINVFLEFKLPCIKKNVEISPVVP